MSTQYRQPLNWTENTIINAENILQKISKSLDNNNNTHNQKDEEFIKLLCDDLNTPNAIQYLIKQAKLAKNNNEELAKLRYNCDLIGIKNNIAFNEHFLLNKLLLLACIRILPLPHPMSEIDFTSSKFKLDFFKILTKFFHLNSLSSI